jgi:hypothetical protein
MRLLMRLWTILAFVPLLAGCDALFYWPDDIQPTDKIKTADDAIHLIQHACAGGDKKPDHWDAHLEGDTWIVTWKAKRESVDAEIKKSDGFVTLCRINHPDY